MEKKPSNSKLGALGTGITERVGKGQRPLKPSLALSFDLLLFAMSFLVTSLTDPTASTLPDLLLLMQALSNEWTSSPSEGFGRGAWILYGAPDGAVQRAHRPSHDGQWFVNTGHTMHALHALTGISIA